MDQAEPTTQSIITKQNGRLFQWFLNSIPPEIRSECHKYRIGYHAIILIDGMGDEDYNLNRAIARLRQEIEKRKLEHRTADLLREVPTDKLAHISNTNQQQQNCNHVNMQQPDNWSTPSPPPTHIPQPPTHIPQPPTHIPQPPTHIPQPPTHIPQPPTPIPLPPTYMPPPPTHMPPPPTHMPPPPMQMPPPPMNMPPPPTHIPLPPIHMPPPPIHMPPPPIHMPPPPIHMPPPPIHIPPPPLTMPTPLLPYTQAHEPWTPQGITPPSTFNIGIGLNFSYAPRMDNNTQEESDFEPVSTSGMPFHTTDLTYTTTHGYYDPVTDDESEEYVPNSTSFEETNSVRDNIPSSSQQRNSPEETEHSFTEVITID